MKLPFQRSGLFAAVALSFATLSLTLAAPVAHAAGEKASIVVEGVQMPAWIERSGARPEPLTPGTELRPSDQIKTGAGSRLLLRSSDGSSVKLGENATFKLNSLEQRGNVFAAAMNVLEGAFRFTTDKFARHRQRREVDIQVATVTAGIRGTDLWGKSDASKQIVCLIEGRIQVTPPGESAITMDQDKQFYVRDQGKSQPVAAVPDEQIKTWSAETEIEAGKGAMRRGGQWKIGLGNATSQEEALKLYDDVRAAGYAASLYPSLQGDKRVYSVRIGNLPSKAEAVALADELKGKFGSDAPKIFK